jgi:hypothetical protein
MLCLSYYCLFLLFSRTGEMSRTGSAWKGVGREGVGAGGGRREFKPQYQKKKGKKYFTL